MRESTSGKRSPIQWIKDILVAVLIIFGGIYFLIALGSTSSPIQLTRQSTGSVPVGSEGQLRNGSPEMPIAVDAEVLPDVVRVVGNRDLSGLSPLSGRIFYVADGTLVRVSESNFGFLRVRIITGPKKGKLGWVPADWIKPL